MGLVGTEGGEGAREGEGGGRGGEGGGARLWRAAAPQAARGDPSARGMSAEWQGGGVGAGGVGGGVCAGKESGCDNEAARETQEGGVAGGSCGITRWDTSRANW